MIAAASVLIVLAVAGMMVVVYVLIDVLRTVTCPAKSYLEGYSRGINFAVDVIERHGAFTDILKTLRRVASIK
jgi:hypothetical protein